MIIFPKIYFARSNRQRGTRKGRKIIKVLRERGYEVFDPFAGRVKKRVIDTCIVDKDIDLIDFCDAIFCWFAKKHNTHIGSGAELMYAHMTHKRIIALHYQPHIFLLRFADVLYVSFKDFKKDKPYKLSE